MAQAYLTNAEFLDQTIPGDAFTGLDATTITAAILWGSATADSYMRKRLKLPLISWGQELRSAVGELVQFKLLSRRGFRPNSGNDEIAVKRYDDVIAWFKLVARGEVEIDCVDSTPDVDEEGALTSSDEPMSWRNVTGPQGESDE